MNEDVFGQAEDFITLPKISQVFGEVRLGLALVAVFFRMNKCLASKRTVVMHLCGEVKRENLVSNEVDYSLLYKHQ